MWRLNNILLNNPWVKEEMVKEITKYLYMNDNENIKICEMQLRQCLQVNLCLSTTCVTKEGLISDLNFVHKKLEKVKPKLGQRKEI